MTKGFDLQALSPFYHCVLWCVIVYYCLLNIHKCMNNKSDGTNLTHCRISCTFPSDLVAVIFIKIILIKYVYICLLLNFEGNKKFVGTKKSCVDSIVFTLIFPVCSSICFLAGSFFLLQ